MVIGGTPELRIVFELTNERPQKRTVPQTARVGTVLLGDAGVRMSMTVAHATRKPGLRQ
jgi:hypothetical protein